MTTTQTDAIMALADRYAFHIPGSQHSDEARAVLLAALQEQAREGVAVGCNSNCDTCIYHHQSPAQAGWCYMFYNEPIGVCGQWKDAAPQPAQPTVKWCEQCGEGVTDFCRGKGAKCEYGFKPAGQPSEPAQPEQGERTSLVELAALLKSWLFEAERQSGPEAAGWLERAIEAIQKAQPVAQPLTPEELELCRQWFDSVQDLNGGYLTPLDYVLAEKLYKQLNMRVPNSISEITKSGIGGAL